MSSCFSFSSAFSFSFLLAIFSLIIFLSNSFFSCLSFSSLCAYSCKFYLIRLTSSSSSLFSISLSILLFSSFANLTPPLTSNLLHPHHLVVVHLQLLFLLLRRLFQNISLHLALSNSSEILLYFLLQSEILLFLFNLAIEIFFDFVFEFLLLDELPSLLVLH